MPGKISGVTSSQPASPATGGAGQRTAAAANSAPSSASTTATDSVKITDTASFLVSAEQTLSDVPVVNADRVSQVTNALAAGTYKISPERIANNLLQFERLLPQDSAD